MYIIVDDTDPSLTYSGQWTAFSGSPLRQWDSTAVHSTSQSGASVSFKFQGSVCKVYGTVPTGNGNTVLMDVTIDGFVSPTVSRTTGSAAQYSNLFHQSGEMDSSVWHTVVITNRGGAGNVDFQFSGVEVDTPGIFFPSISPFAPPPVPHPHPPVSPPHPPAPPSPPSQTLPSSTSSILPKTSLNPTGAMNSTSITSVANSQSGASSISRPPKTLTQSTVPSTSLTQIMTTTSNDTSFLTSQVTSFPLATSQPTSKSAHKIPVGTIIGIVGGIIGLLILILLLILCLQQWKARNHRLALTRDNREISAQDKYQDRTAVATPFTFGPSLSGDVDAAFNSPSRLPLFPPMSRKALHQQTRSNRYGNDPEAGSSPTTALFSPLNATAYSTSTPSTRGTGSISNPGAWSTFPLRESFSFSPQSPLEPNQTDMKGAASSLGYLSASANPAGPSMSVYGDMTSDLESMYEGLPAYRLHE